MVRLFCILCGLLLLHEAYSQETRIIKETRTRKISEDSLIFLLGETQVDGSILQLLMPSEITFKQDLNSKFSQKNVLKIDIKDTTHAVLKYVKYKATLKVNDKFYEYGVIPPLLNPTQISKLLFFTSEGHIKDILEVVLVGEEVIPNKRVRYSTEPIRVEYYDIDGKIVTKEELASMKLVKGIFEAGPLISGNDAVVRYGNAKYATGVRVIRRKK